MLLLIENRVVDSFTIIWNIVGLELPLAISLLEAGAVH